MNAKRDADRLSSSLSVDIEQVSKTDWRVSASADHVLGFVEQIAPHRFEILWLTEPMRWGYTDSFTEAIAAVAGADASVTSISGERDWAARTAGIHLDATSVTTPPTLRHHHRETWKPSTTLG